MKRLLFAGLLVCVGLSVPVGIAVSSAASDLVEAQRLLAGGHPTSIEIARAAGLARNAHVGLSGYAGWIARMIPLVRPNVEAMDTVATGTARALEDGMVVQQTIERLAEATLVKNGTVRLSGLSRLHGELAALAKDLEDLEKTIAGRRSPWLVPPLWEALDHGLEEVRDLRPKVEQATAVTEVIPRLMGMSGNRSYLVMLVNNAEARGTGGILSGVGTISIRKGKIALGRFEHYTELDEPPYERVQAPADFVRRYRVYKADTTHLVNTTMSPDVPEAALVAARLYHRTRGIRTDGAIVIDPAGIAALLPKGAPISIAEGAKLSRAQLPQYLLSDVYADFPSDQAERRGALLTAGRSAFTALLGEQVQGSVVNEIGRAVAAGHIRVVPFDPEERHMLLDTGVTGALRPPKGDAVYVTVQNFGGDKLDYWSHQSISHSCDISNRVADCKTEVRLRNAAPERLPNYVTQRRRKATLKSFVELYVPSDAEITRVEVDGEIPAFSRQEENGHAAIGVYLKLPRGASSVTTVAYSLALERRYRLDVRPQPLARPATFDLTLTAPESWRFDRGGSTVRAGGRLVRPISLRAAPIEHPYLAGLWDALAGREI